MAAVRNVPILMYHSVSDGAGPTCIPPELFREQMKTIADAGCAVVSLSRFAAWRLDGSELPPRSVVITFDDGFRDFANDAFPCLETHGFASTVFLPTRRLDGAEAWRGAATPARPLMDWTTVADLASRGVEFAPHSRTHADLAGLSGRELEDEIVGSQQDMQERLGIRSPHFAPPYGSIGAEGLAVIQRTYSASVGVGLGRADRASPVHDLPRIEMHYYREAKRFQSLLEGTGGAYLNLRRAMRGARKAIGRRSAHAYS
ncbi:MAG: polysaccharide deacetylase family protein [Alphaproteobacteria bacterium]|nr:polysaccharide deacetylase family protein [Alphaproteobacteria bacterium]